MKYLIEKDRHRRQLVYEFEKKRLSLKALSRDHRLPLGLRIVYRLFLSNFVRNASRTRVKNRCTVTGRSRGVFRFFRLSRLQVRETHLRGLLYGIRKASW